MCFTSTPRMFASHMPITVIASSPDSCTSWLLPMKMPSTQASAPRLCRYSGSQWRRSARPKRKPPAAPNETPQAMTAAKVPSGALPLRLTMKLNTTTASRAPMGSMTMPSQRRMLPTEARGRITRSMGAITVGPVTRVRVPNSSARSQGKSSR